VDGWGCIRNATLPAHAFLKQFKYTKNKEILPNLNFNFNTFSQNKIKDNFNTLNTNLWQVSTIDLIKGNKPLYKPENILFSKNGLKMQTNRD
jgi:hypothetical protein